jgi:hypothetical protein
MQGEQNARTRCDENTGPFMTYSAEDVSAGKVPKPIDTFRLSNGTYSDGSPFINGLGCSAHWFDEHRTFKNGGLVTLGYYEHGAAVPRRQQEGRDHREGLVPAARRLDVGDLLGVGPRRLRDRLHARLRDPQVEGRAAQALGRGGRTGIPVPPPAARPPCRRHVGGPRSKSAVGRPRRRP